MEVWINVAAPGAHHQTFLRRQTHRRIHALAMAERRCAAAIAKVRRDKLRFLDRFAQPFCRLQTNENRPAKIFSTMNNAMPDRFDFQFLAAAEKLDDPQ